MSFVFNKKLHAVDPPLSIPKREVIISRFQNVLKIGDQKCNRSIQQIEEIMMMKLLKRMSEGELDTIKRTNSSQADRKIRQLKQKLRKSVSTLQNQLYQNNQTHQDRLFYNNHFNSGSLQQQKNSKTKPNRRMENKHIAYDEARSIMNEKTKYKNWLNSHHNNFKQSPNIKKMTHMLKKQKSYKGKQNQEQPKNSNMGLIYNAKFDLSKASKMKKEESQTQGRSKSVQNIFDNFN